MPSANAPLGHRFSRSPAGPWPHVYACGSNPDGGGEALTTASGGNLVRAEVTRNKRSPQCGAATIEGADTAAPAGPWPHADACGLNPDGEERRPLRGRSPMFMLAAQTQAEENGGPCGALASCLCLRPKSGGGERRPLRGRSPTLMLAAQTQAEENGGPCGALAPCLCLRPKSGRRRTAAPAGPWPHADACGSNPEGGERRPLRGLGPMFMLAAQIRKEEERRLPQSQSARRVLLAHYSPLVSIDSLESLLPSANAPLGHRFSRSPAGPWPHADACGLNPAEEHEKAPAANATGAGDMLVRQLSADLSAGRFSRS